MNKIYNYFYKITNNINNHFYYGVHCTDNLNDGYMGSGTRLKYAYKKYGMENFSKEILKFFDTVKEAYEYEAEVVNETLMLDPNCYNIKQGGQGWNTHGLATVKDKDGNCFDVPVDDPRIKSGELVGVTKGHIAYKDILTNDVYFINVDDERIKTGELVPLATNMVLMKDKDNKTYFLDKTNPNFQSIINEKELISFFSNKVNVKDRYNNFFQVSIDDPRYVSGELTGVWKNRKHSLETKQKMSNTHKTNKHQQGTANSQYGTCWVYKVNNNSITNLKIKKTELDSYINEGWNKGRKMDSSFSNKVKQGMKNVNKL